MPSEATKPRPPVAPPDGVELLPLDEVGHMLGRISARLVRRLIDQGRLRRVNVTVGNSIWVTRDEVRRFIAENTITDSADSADSAEPPESPAEAAVRREAARAKMKADWNDGSDPFEAAGRKRAGKGVTLPDPTRVGRGAGHKRGPHTLDPPGG